MAPDLPAPKPTISAKRLLLAEGKDDATILQRLLDTEGITGVQVLNYEGTQQLRPRMRLWRRDDGLQDVVAVGIVRDAEASAESALQSVADAVSSEWAFPSPTTHAVFAQSAGKAAGAFILPDGENPGMLECLCVASVEGDPAMVCVNAFMECLRSEAVEIRTPPKAMAHAFLSTRRKAGLTVWQATERKTWDLGHGCWEPLKAFLRELAGCGQRESGVGSD